MNNQRHQDTALQIAPLVPKLLIISKYSLETFCFFVTWNPDLTRAETHRTAQPKGQTCERSTQHSGDAPSKILIMQ